MTTVISTVKRVTISEDGKNITISSLGEQGLSAYAIAVKNGFVGTEQEWIGSIGGGTGGSGDMLKSVYDADGDGKVNSADSADSVSWDGIENKPVTYPPDAHEHTKYALISDIIDSLESNDPAKQLSANQGRVIKGLIDQINTLLYSDDSTLDEMQELVSYIKQNREILSTLSISNIAGLVDALAEKQDAGDYLLASAISAWAKAATKPIYDYSEIENTPDVIAGLISGGSEDQILRKKSASDYDAEWVDRYFPDVIADRYYSGRTVWCQQYVTATGNRTLTSGYIYFSPIAFKKKVPANAFTFKVMTAPTSAAHVKCAMFQLDVENHNVTIRIAQSLSIDVYAGGAGLYIASFEQFDIPDGVYMLAIVSDNNVSVYGANTLQLWQMFGSNDSFGDAWRHNKYGLQLGGYAAVATTDDFPADLTTKTLGVSATNASPLIGIQVA